MSGPEFSDLRPVANGVYAPLNVVGYSYGGLNAGKIVPVVAPGASPDCFREGETLIIYLEVRFPLEQVINNPDAVYVSGLRIKPWFLRSAVEMRTPGNPATSGNPVNLVGGLIPTSPTTGTVPCASNIDSTVFGDNGGTAGWSILDHPFDPSTGAQFTAAVNTNLPTGAPEGGRTRGNRYFWIPVPKRLDTLPAAWGSAPLNIARGFSSDSILLDDVWLVPLPNPRSLPWSAAPWNTPNAGDLQFPWSYKVARVFQYGTLGRALGLSFEVTLAKLADDSPFIPTGIPEAPNNAYPRVRVGYRAGVTHTENQERVG